MQRPGQKAGEQKMDQFYPNGMIHEDHFSETMETVVRPALRKIRKDRMVAGADGKKLFVSVFPSEGKKGTVIIHHGFTESVEKFSEVIYALNQAGYTVGMHEARGHGRSYTDPGVDKASGDTYVAHFDDYVEDLHALMGTVYRDLPRPYFLLCHSMGGAVGALYLEKYPGVFEKAVLSSPMIAPSTYGIPKPVVMMICTTMTAVGKGKNRIMMSKGYTGHEDFATSATTSKARFDWYDDMKYAVKEFQNSSPTFCWTKESVRVTNRILKPGEVEKISIPVLVLQAPEDQSVLVEPMDRFAQRLKYGKIERFEGAKHEIYRCVDKTACRWMDAVLAFLAS